MSVLTRARPRPLVLLLLAAYVVLLLSSLGGEMTREIRAPQATDFISFFTGARLVQTDPSCLYCEHAQRAVQLQAAGPIGHNFFNAFVNLPLAGWVLSPLTRLSLNQATLVFDIASLFALLGATVLLSRRLPASWPRWLRAAMLTATAGLLCTADAIAQWDTFMLLALAGTLVALEAEADLAAGLLLAACVVKPQLVWLVVPALMVIGRWRVVGGAALGGAVWLVSGVVLVGPAQMVEWVRLALHTDVGQTSAQVGPAGLAALAAGNGAGIVFSVAAVIALLVLGWRFRDALRRDPVAAVAIAIAASLASTPHLWIHDLLLLAVPLAVWGVRRPGAALAAAGAVDFLYLADMVSANTLIHLEALVVVAVLAGLGQSVISGQRRPRSQMATLEAVTARR